MIAFLRRNVGVDQADAEGERFALLQIGLDETGPLAGDRLRYLGVAVTWEVGENQRGAVLALLFLALRELYWRLRGRDGLGLGDVKFAAAAGVWLDWPAMPVAIEIAALAALALYVLGHVLGRRRIQATTRLPFGLFLAPAIWLAWLFQVWLDTF